MDEKNNNDFELKIDNGELATSMIPEDFTDPAILFEKLKEIAIEKGQTIKSAPLVYKAKRQTPATKHQIERLKEYMVSHNIIDVISWETLTRSQASRLYDEYLAKYGRK